MQLIVFQNDRQVKRVKITANRSRSFTIGRADDCSLVLDEDGVSNYHATIYNLPDGSFDLVDDDSVRGTLVNGKVISGHELTFGDKITIGSYTLVAVCDHSANGTQQNKNQTTSKGETTMTNLVKATLYVAFGILGGFCLFWGNVAFFFILIPVISLAFFSHRLQWWGLCTAAIGHGIGFGLMRGFWEGVAIALLSAGIYLILWNWAFQSWKKNHPAATVTNTKR